ncbi:MAG: signal recognition particle protein [Mycoplasma sp.]|nr:signal recognition particle protein [Candidatus Hennigella equi]
MFKSMISGIIARNMKKKLTNWTISEEDVTEVLKQIRIALLDADVNLLVVKNFIKSVREKAVGYVMEKGQEPDKVLLSIVKEELVTILGKNQEDLKLDAKQTRIMLVGLNGAGKTTTIAKVANWLKIKKEKKPMLVALDVYRPAAIDQLDQLAQKINVPCYKEPGKDVIAIAEHAMHEAEKNGNDVILFDTAGRLQTNVELMNELKNIKKEVKPQEIILVVDAMAGQDIINVAKEFHETLDLTGLIITKLDSEARAGAVLSITNLLNIPVKFTGTGEAIGSLDIFYPDRMADQILGLGDIMSLAEKAADRMDESSAKKSFTRMISGKFDLEDLMTQMEQISRLGSLGGLMKMLPGNLANRVSEDDINSAEQKMIGWRILMSSMTKKERRNPALFKKQPNRKIRVVKGSGRKPDELNKMLSQWEKAKVKMDEIGRKIKSGKNPLMDLMKGGGMR